MSNDAQGSASDPYEDLIAAAVTTLPDGEAEMTAHAIRAARDASGHHFGYLAALGSMKLQESEPGTTAITMDITPPILNGYGFVHGGMLFTLADYAMGATALKHVDPGCQVVTLEGKANYMENVREGTVIAHCELLHKTRHLITLETRIHETATEKLLMVVTGSFYIIQPHHAAGTPITPQEDSG